jgi:hypothetical protein
LFADGFDVAPERLRRGIGFRRAADDAQARGEYLVARGAPDESHGQEASARDVVAPRRPEPVSRLSQSERALLFPVIDTQGDISL